MCVCWREKRGERSGGFKQMPEESFKWMNANSESLKHSCFDRIHCEHLSFAEELR